MRQAAKPSRKTFHERLTHMVQSLRSDIMNNAYRTGDYLPPEKLLAEQYDLSNKSVRKGLDLLVKEGLIQKIDRVGSQVLETATIDTITVGYSTTIDRDIALTYLIEDFHNLYPTIRVKGHYFKFSRNYMNTICDYMDNGIIDCFTLNGLDVEKLNGDGKLGLIEAQPHNEEVYPFSQEAFTISGQIVGRPLIFSPIILAYNRPHFLEADVPEPDGSWTWNDVIHHAAKLTEPGVRYGLSFHLLSDNRWPAFLLQSGMSFHDFDDPQTFKQSALMDSIRLYKHLTHNKAIFSTFLSESNEDVTELFKQDKVSMTLTTYMTLNDLKQTGIDYDISPMPYIAQPKSLVHVIGIAMNRKSSKKQSVRLFMDYLASERAQSIVKQHSFSLPATKKVAERPIMHKDFDIPSRFYLFREIASSYALHKALGLSDSAFEKVRSLLKQYWSDTMTEDTLCAEIGRTLKEHRIM